MAKITFTKTSSGYKSKIGKDYELFEKKMKELDAKDKKKAKKRRKPSSVKSTVKKIYKAAQDESSEMIKEDSKNKRRAFLVSPEVDKAGKKVSKKYKKVGKSGKKIRRKIKENFSIKQSDIDKYGKKTKDIIASMTDFSNKIVNKFTGEDKPAKKVKSKPRGKSSESLQADTRERMRKSASEKDKQFKKSAVRKDTKIFNGSPHEKAKVLDKRKRLPKEVAHDIEGKAPKKVKRLKRKAKVAVKRPVKKVEEKVKMVARKKRKVVKSSKKKRKAPVIAKKRAKPSKKVSKEVQEKRKKAFKGMSKAIDSDVEKDQYSGIKPTFTRIRNSAPKTKRGKGSMPKRRKLKY